MFMNVVLPRYQAQVTLLSSTLRPLYGADIEIGTVDGMQGREKDAVVISLVRSNDKVKAELSSYIRLIAHL
jgi:DNA polymerase alpha-associated DNA helicase A